MILCTLDLSLLIIVFYFYEMFYVPQAFLATINKVQGQSIKYSGVICILYLYF